MDTAVLKKQIQQTNRELKQIKTVLAARPAQRKSSRVQSKDSLKENALTDQAQEESRARVPILEKRLVELKTQLDALQNKPAPLPQSDSIPRSPKTSDVATNDASNSVATPATAEAAPLPSQNLAATGDAPPQPPAAPAALKVTLPKSTPAATNDAPPQPPAAPAALKVALPKSTPAATDDATTTSWLEINAEDGMNDMKLAVPEKPNPEMIAMLSMYTQDQINALLAAVGHPPSAPPHTAAPRRRPATARSTKPTKQAKPSIDKVNFVKFDKELDFVSGDLDTRRYTKLDPNYVWVTLRSRFFRTYASEFSDDPEIEKGILDCTGQGIEEKAYWPDFREHLKDWGALSERDKSIINCYGRAVIQMFLFDILRGDPEPKITETWLKVLVSKVPACLPEAGTTNRAVAREFMTTYRDRLFRCRYHNNERHYNRSDDEDKPAANKPGAATQPKAPLEPKCDQSGFFAGVGFPPITTKGVDPHPDHCHCGCYTEDVLSDFFDAKSLELWSSNPDYDTQLWTMNFQVHPRIRSFVTHSLILKTGIRVADRYTGVQMWGSMNDLQQSWHNDAYLLHIAQVSLKAAQERHYRADKLFGKNPAPAPDSPAAESTTTELAPTPDTPTRQSATSGTKKRKVASGGSEASTSKKHKSNEDNEQQSDGDGDEDEDIDIFGASDLSTVSESDED